MARITLDTGDWRSWPTLNYYIQYEYKRSGNNMIYTIYVGIKPLSSMFGYNITGKVTLNGTAHNITVKGNTPSSWTTNQETNTGELTVTNKTSGTVPLTVYLTSNSPVSTDLTKSFNLPILPAASTVSATDAVIGEQSTITINKSVSSYTHTLSYKVGSGSYSTIVSKTSSSSYKWTLPTSLYNSFSSTGTNVTVTIQCQTYDGSTLVGTATTTTLKAKQNLNDVYPRFTLSQTILNRQTTLTTDANTIIKNYSNVEVKVIDLQLKYGATAKETSVTLGDKTVSLGTSGGGYTYNQVTSNVIKGYVKDSRGNSNTITGTAWPMIDYIKPTISSNNPEVAISGQTASVSIPVQGKWFNGSFGKSSNTKTVSYCYKKSTDSSYGSWTTFTTSGSGNNYSGTLTKTGLDYQYTYNFKVRIVDKLLTVESPAITVQCKPIFDWDYDDFNFNVPVNVNGALVASNIKVGSNNVATTADLNDCVKTSGSNTMSGTYTISGSITKNTTAGGGFSVKDTNTGLGVDLLIGDGLNNHGIYSRKKTSSTTMANHWMIFENSTDYVLRHYNDDSSSGRVWVEGGYQPLAWKRQANVVVTSGKSSKVTLTGATSSSSVFCLRYNSSITGGDYPVVAIAQPTTDGAYFSFDRTVSYSSTDGCNMCFLWTK